MTDAGQFSIFVRQTRYQVLLTPNGSGRYVAKLPALPDCSFEAESLTDAIGKAHGAIEHCLDAH